MFEVARLVTPAFAEISACPAAFNINSAATTVPATFKTQGCSSTTTATTIFPGKIKTLSLKDFHNPETRPKFLQEMRHSLMEIGTFYIKDHGISIEVTTDAMKTVQEYFALPLEEKKKMLIVNSRHFRGYKVMGEEFTNNQLDHREQLQFGPEQDPITTFQPSISPDFHGLQGPNQWPTSTLALVPRFQPCILDFMRQLEQLSQQLMEAVALSLGLSGSYFRDLFGKTPYYRLKCARYPSVKKSANATIGCGAHKDTGFLTVLLQDMVGGLQGQDPKTGQWMETRPIPETFIVTMGEAIEKLTGGLYHATVHRVLNNTSGQDRYSIPFFFDPSLDAQIPSKIKGLYTGSNIDFSSKTLTKNDEIKVEGVAHGLDIATTSSFKPSTTSSSSMSNSYDEVDKTWSNGAHVFETVYRCHPEVYARWYDREL